VRLFSGLTALENVEVASVGVGLPRAEVRRRAVRLLSHVGLLEKAHHDARELSHGDARRLGIARALATGPRFLLLDEPAAGLDESESRQLVAMIRSIRDELECGILAIEHDMDVIMALSERLHVLDYGRTLAIGTPEEIRTNPAVLEAYLGKRRAA
jgi:branched-chain amino acid transport system ATP-binding protein